MSIGKQINGSKLDFLIGKLKPSKPALHCGKLAFFPSLNTQVLGTWLPDRWRKLDSRTRVGVSQKCMK